MGKLDPTTAKEQEDFKPVPLPKQEAQSDGKKPTRGVGPNVSRRVAVKRLKRMHRKYGKDLSLREYALQLKEQKDPDAIEWLENKS